MSGTPSRPPTRPTFDPEMAGDRPGEVQRIAISADASASRSSDGPRRPRWRTDSGSPPSGRATKSPSGLPPPTPARIRSARARSDACRTTPSPSREDRRLRGCAPPGGPGGSTSPCGSSVTRSANASALASTSRDSWFAGMFTANETTAIARNSAGTAAADPGSAAARRPMAPESSRTSNRPSGVTRAANRIPRGMSEWATCPSSCATTDRSSGSGRSLRSACRRGPRASWARGLRRRR